jgi:hypothetical protein
MTHLLMLIVASVLPQEDREQDLERIEREVADSTRLREGSFLFRIGTNY